MTWSVLVLLGAYLTFQVAFYQRSFVHTTWSILSGLLQPRVVHSGKVREKIFKVDNYPTISLQRAFYLRWPLNHNYAQESRDRQLHMKLHSDDQTKTCPSLISTQNTSEQFERNSESEHFCGLFAWAFSKGIP